MSADISESFFCCRAARVAEGGTLARQKVIFPTYMPPEKYLIVGFLAVKKPDPKVRLFVSSYCHYVI